MTIVGMYDSCGSRSAFYVIDNERGFKEFEDREDAEYAHKTQSRLSAYDLAPNVLSEIGKIRYDNGNLSSWGYMSEIAELIGCGGNECHCGECNDLAEHNQHKIDKLIRKIADVGMEFMDAHIGNVGYIRRKSKNVLVCIDCGQESVYDEDNSCYDDELCSCEGCVNMRKAYA